MKQLLKVIVSEGAANVQTSKGNIQNIAVSVTDNICRLTHPSFSEATTFGFASFFELYDNETTLVVTPANGTVDVTVYDATSQVKDHYAFQIKIEVHE